MIKNNNTEKKKKKKKKKKRIWRIKYTKKNINNDSK